MVHEVQGTPAAGRTLADIHLASGEEGPVSAAPTALRQRRRVVGGRGRSVGAGPRLRDRAQGESLTCPAEPSTSYDDNDGAEGPPFAWDYTWDFNAARGPGFAFPSCEHEDPGASAPASLAIFRYAATTRLAPFARHSRGSRLARPSRLQWLRYDSASLGRRWAGKVRSGKKKHGIIACLKGRRNGRPACLLRVAGNP